MRIQLEDNFVKVQMLHLKRRVAKTFSNQTNIRPMSEGNNLRSKERHNG